jgi:myosin heavy subunit
MIDKMRSEKLDKLLNIIRKLRLIRLVLQIFLLVISSVLIFELNRRAADIYLFYHPVLLFVLSAGIILLLSALPLRLFWHDDEQKLASELDQDYKLKDRLITYLELRDTSHPFLPALINESETHLPNVQLLQSARLQQGSAAPLLFTAILAVALATFSYWPVSSTTAARAEQHRQIAKSSQQFAKELQKIQKSSTSPEIKKLTQDFLKAVERMNKPDVDPAKALQKMNEMNQQLKDLNQQMEKQEKNAFAQNLKSMNDSNTKGQAEKNHDKELEKEAAELKEAMEKEGLEGGEELRQKMENGNLSQKDLEKMKKALEKYQEGKKSRSEQMAELQESLEGAQKGMTGGKHKVIYNSQIKDRDIEKSKGGVNDGPGTTNKDIGPQHFDTKKEGPSKYAEDRTKAEYEQLYSGQRENVGKDPMFLGSQWDAEKSRYVRVRTFGQSNEPQILGGDASTTQQNEAESIVGKEKIPASYRDIILRYFESIER